MHLEEVLEVPQQRGVNFFGAAKRRSDQFAEDHEGMHHFLVITVGERSNRCALQEGESCRGGNLRFNQPVPPMGYPQSLRLS